MSKTAVGLFEKLYIAYDVVRGGGALVLPTAPDERVKDASGSKRLPGHGRTNPRAGRRCLPFRLVKRASLTGRGHQAKLL